MPRRRPRRTHTVADLRQIAWYQKFLILCMLGQLFVWLGYIAYFALSAGPGRANRAFEPITLAFIATGLLGLFGAIFVVLMSLKTSGTAMGVVLGVLTLVPCLSLIIIVIANAQATSVLQRNGVRVGLIGARMADIADLPEMNEEEDDEEWDEDRPRRRHRRGYAEIDEDEGW